MSVGVSEADDFALLGHRDAATRAAAAKSLAKRRQLSPALAVFLRADRDVKVRVAAERSLTRTLEGHEVARLLRSDEPEERVLGADAVLDIGTLTALARDPSPLVREVVAQGSPPVDLLMALAHDSSDDVRLAVARDFRSAREVYEILERDQTERVREEALRRRNWRLERNDDIAAALGLNLHRILSGESGSARGALTVMISAPHTSLRVRLARQPWIPAETLAQWAHDVEPAVVEAVAGNPSTPVSVLALIMESRWGPDPRIAMANVAMRADVRETAWRFPQGIFRDDVLDLPSELLEVIGTNPLTLPRTLARIAEHAGDTVAAALARNPSTPSSTLEWIAKCHADSTEVARALVSNPRSSALVYGVLHATRNHARALAGGRSAPSDVLVALADHEDLMVRRSVALNPRTPDAVVERFVDDIEVRAPYLGAPGAPTFVEPLTWQRRGHAERLIAEDCDAAMLPEPRSALEVAGVLVRAHATSEKVHVASSTVPLEPTFVEGILVRDEAPQVRRSLAGSVYASDRQRSRLADDSDESVRASVARYTCDASVLERLARDPSAQVRGECVHNPIAATGVLRALVARVPNHELAYIAQHSEASADLLADLAGSGSSHTREAVAANGRTPVYSLDALAKAPEVEVRRAVAGNSSASPEALATMVADRSDDVRRLVAAHRSTPGAALETLSLESDFEICLLVALHPRSTPGALKRLSRDGRAAIRQAVALHPSAPEVLWTDLVRDADAGVRELARRHMRSSPTERRRVAADESTPADTLAALAADSAVAVREALASNRRTPVDALVTLSKDADQGVRGLLGGRSGLPRAALEHLAHDPVWRIRRAARKRLR